MKWKQKRKIVQWARAERQGKAKGSRPWELIERENGSSTLIQCNLWNLYGILRTASFHFNAVRLFLAK